MSFLFRTLSVLFFVSFISVLFVAFHVPIYSDEIGWKMITSRFFLDSGSAFSLYPHCIKNWPNTPKMFFVPRLLESALFANISDPAKLRLWGMLLFGGLLCLFGMVAKKNISPNKPTPDIYLHFISLLTIGVLPFGLVLARPEPFLFLTLLLIVFLPFLSNQSSLSEYLFTFCLLVSGLFFFSAHPKSLFFTTSLLVSLLFFNCRPPFKLMGVLFIIWGSITSFKFYKSLTTCTDNPGFQSLISSYMLSPEVIFSDLN